MTPYEKYRRSEKGRATIRAAALRAYRRDPVKAAYQRSISQARFYGYSAPDVSLEQYREMVRTHTVCDICGKGLGTRLCLDHCHVTGVTRGMLCRPCNTAIGLLEDSVERLKLAARYLENAEIVASIKQKS